VRRWLQREFVAETDFQSLSSASGGTLATAMGGYDIFTSDHFKTALLVLGMLIANGAFALSGFGSDPKSKISGRTAHAYIGAATVLVVAAHVATGVALVLS